LARVNCGRSITIKWQPWLVSLYGCLQSIATMRSHCTADLLPPVDDWRAERHVREVERRTCRHMHTTSFHKDTRITCIRYCNDMDNPPSTNSCAPVTYLLRWLARKTAGPAKSSGSPTRPNGVRFSRYFSLSGFARSSAASCVLVVPGSRALHLMPYLPRAHASLCIMLSTAALVGV
jgi:hypothetical protein